MIVIHGASAISPNLLILGGTTEATALARAADAAGVTGTVSLAGRVARPRDQALSLRIGGFGGVAGLIGYLRSQGVTHIVDATHPFAAQMSSHAVVASAATGVPLIALTRPAWRAEPGDRWFHVPDMAGAVAALDRERANVFLAIGRMHLAAFAVRPRHRYTLRLVETPQAPLPLPDTRVVVARGPFDIASDMSLMRDHAIDLVVSKNAGGAGAYAKIAAARALNLPVIMIDRPTIPPRPEAATIAQVMDWLAHAGATERGV